MSQAFASALVEHTARILAHAASLRSVYQPHDLHQFRVHIRRTRSLLKRMHGGPADFYLRNWRDLFAVTSPARDLDVLQGTAARLLPPEQFGLFDSRLRPHLSASREAVARLLRSGRWKRHLAGWRGLLRNLELRPREVPRAPVPGAVEEARQACRTAVVLDTDRDWHKFRIAVKNLRYVADASRAEPGADTAGLDRIIEDCKVLQTLLGDWHDTVVQLNIIQDPKGGLGADLTDTRELAAITASLADRIRERKGILLARIGETVAAGNAFIPP
jgi:CHAD domain-containing protein